MREIKDPAEELAKAWDAMMEEIKNDPLIRWAKKLAEKIADKLARLLNETKELEDAVENVNGKTWWRQEAPEPATVKEDGTLGGYMAKVAQNNVDITMKTFFLNTYAEEIQRPGADDLLDWLESTDFFTAPAGAKHHGAFYGGLMIHSMNVWRRLQEITIRDLTDRNAPGVYTLSAEERETVAILGLLHDICKVGVYHTETKRRKNQTTGQWEDYQAYTFRDPFPLGHGEKSLYQISRFMKLTEAEALAIRWHMGAFDAAARGGSRDLNAAMDATPWVWRLHEADMCAAHIDEKEAPADD